MSRDVAEILAQLERLLPAYWSTGEALLAGFAGAQAQAEASAQVLQGLATLGGASGMWLTLHAHGVGVQRAIGESDDSLRGRLRRVEDQVTKPAIEAAVNALIAPDTCTVIEWWEQPYLDVDDDVGAWLDNASCRLSGGPPSFIVLIPEQGTTFSFGDYLDATMWLDSGFVGDAPEDPVYDAICNEVNRMRAAGTFWRLALEE